MYIESIPWKEMLPVLKSTVRKGNWRSGIVDAEGRRQGPWKEFYETGELRSEGKYKRGLRDGDWVFYYRDGKEEQRGGYYRGKPERRLEMDLQQWPNLEKNPL